MSHPPFCSDCGADLPSDENPCPRCGSARRTLRVNVSDTLNISVKESLTLEGRREFYEKHPRVIAVVIAITVVSSLMGLYLTGIFGVIAGLALGALSYFLSPMAVIKVREITRIHRS